MKTIVDIIELVRNFMKEDSCNKTTCKDCAKINWCYIDTYLFTLEYLFNYQY
jgi:hypothetical protein